MRVEINSSELKDIVSLMEPVSSLEGAIIPYELMISQIGLVSQSFSVGAKVPLPESIDSCLGITLYKQFFEIVRSLPSDQTVKIEVTGSTMTMKCGSIDCSFTLHPTEINSMWTDEPKFDTSILLPKSFPSLLKKGASIASKSVSNPHLKYVHLTPFGLEAANGPRAWKSEFHSFEFNGSLVFDIDVAQCLSKYEFNLLKVSEDILEFGSEGSSLIVRVRPAGITFHELGWFWSNVNDAVLYDRSTLPMIEPVIKRASLFLNDENFVRIKKEGSILSVEGESSYGKFHEQLECDDDNLIFDIRIDHKFLLNEFDNCNKFGLAELNSVGMLILQKEDEESRQTYVVALARR
jgi:hypothetical protein